MKKTLILLFVICLSSSAYSQYGNGAVKLNLFGLAVGQFQVGYEHALSESATVQLSAGFVSRSWDLGTAGFTNEQKDQGFILVPEYRYYISGEALKGAYAGAFARYRSVTTTYTQSITGSDDNVTEYSRSAVGGGLLLGYQFIVAEKVALDLFAGPQYKTSSTEVTSGVDQGITLEGDGEGIGLRFGFNVGFILQ